jgi:hypothetical protein
MTDEAHMPHDARLRVPGLKVWCYENLLRRHSPEYSWPVFDENTASSLCYTRSEEQNREREETQRLRLSRSSVQSRRSSKGGAAFGSV